MHLIRGNPREPLPDCLLRLVGPPFDKPRSHRERVFQRAVKNQKPRLVVPKT